jgi:hypothetical protein
MACLAAPGTASATEFETGASICGKTNPETVEDCARPVLEAIRLRETAIFWRQLAVNLVLTGPMADRRRNAYLMISGHPGLRYCSE